MRDPLLHVMGKSKYVDDFPNPEGLLFGAVRVSDCAHAEILKIEVEEAANSRGVKAVFLARDIPGKNQIGNIIQDEELLASGNVHFIGQPIALVVADDPLYARNAAKKIKVEYKELEAVFDPRTAYEKGLFIAAPRTLAVGDVDSAWRKCDVIVEGRADSGGQEHAYLETQGSLAVPKECGVKIYSSTQAPTAVQRAAAAVLNLPMHEIEVDVLRLGDRKSVV